MPLVDKSDFLNYQFETVVPDGDIYQFFMKDVFVDKNIPVGWVLVNVDLGECFIIHIQVRDKYRRKGYGRRLIEALKAQFDMISTDYEKTSIGQAGFELCLKCGFEMKRSLHKRKAGKLVWKRSKDEPVQKS